MASGKALTGKIPMAPMSNIAVIIKDINFAGFFIPISPFSFQHYKDYIMSKFKRSGIIFYIEKLTSRLTVSYPSTNDCSRQTDSSTKKATGFLFTVRAKNSAIPKGFFEKKKEGLRAS